MKYLLLFFASFLLFSSASCQNRNSQAFKDKYCFENKGHSLTVIFKSGRDSVYRFYLDIIDNGNYLNGFDDSSDYAGRFSLKQLKDGKVNLLIKSYRDADSEYSLNLELNEKNGWIYWNINEKGPVAYLPRHATLKKCR